MTDDTAPSPEATLSYRGELVRLAAIDPEADAETFAAWFDDPVSTRLAGFRPVWPMNRASAQEKLEEWVKASPGAINFAARTIASSAASGSGTSTTPTGTRSWACRSTSRTTGVAATAGR